MQLSLKDIDIRSILKDIVKNFIIVILACVAAFLAVRAAYTITYKPEYTSTATLAVSARGDDGAAYSSLYLTSEMAEVFSEVFESSALKRIIAQSMGVKSINGTISVKIIKETNLIVLTVTSDTPENTYLIIKSALENYGMVSDYLFSNARLDQLKAPTVPFAPSNPYNDGSVANIAVLAAAVLSLGMIVFVSITRSTIKNPSMAKRKLDGKVIGVITFAKKFTLKELIKRLLSRNKKHNKGLLITSLTVGLPFVESVKRVSAILERHMRHRSEKILLVTSVEENEGKSSVAANIAISLSQKGCRTLLVDGDLKKPSIHKIFEKEKGEYASFSDCITSKAHLQNALVKESDNLYLLCQYTGVHNSGKKLSSIKTGEIMKACKEYFDYIVVDSTPINISADAEVLLMHCDAISLVIRQDRAFVGIINDVTDSIKRSGKDFTGYILNAFKGPKITVARNSYYSTYYKKTDKKQEVTDDGGRL